MSNLTKPIGFLPKWFDYDF